MWCIYSNPNINIICCSIQPFRYSIIYTTVKSGMVKKPKNDTEADAEQEDDNGDLPTGDTE